MPGVICALPGRAVVVLIHVELPHLGIHCGVGRLDQQAVAEPVEITRDEAMCFGLADRRALK